MVQLEREAHEKLVREAEYITEVVGNNWSEKERNEMRLGKLTGSIYEYEIWLVSKNPEQWMVFSHNPSATPLYGDTPRECLERVVVVDAASPCSTL